MVDEWWLGREDDLENQELGDTGEYDPNAVLPYGYETSYKITVPTTYTDCIGERDLRCGPEFIPFMGYTLRATLCLSIFPAVVRQQSHYLYLGTVTTVSATPPVDPYTARAASVPGGGGPIASWSETQYYDIPNKMGQIYYRHRFGLPEHLLDYRLIEHIFALGAGHTYTRTVTPLSQTIPAGAGFAPVIWEFTRFISFAEFSAIINSQQITLNQGSDPANDVNAFIEEVEFRIFDGETKFKMSAST